MATYRIIGADNKEYGPISTDQMRQWIAEGRVNLQTRVLPEGATEWKTVGELPEFAAPATPPPGPGMPPAPGLAIPSMPTTAAYGASSDQVNGPAIALIVLGALNIVLAVGRIAMTLAGFGTAALQNSSNDMQKSVLAFMGTFGIALFAIGIIGGLLILFGGIKMRRLQSYGLCMTASIVAMIPCVSVCCIIGLPIGIWSLVVLSKPEVKSLFQ